jgi:hypothetical protein
MKDMKDRIYTNGDKEHTRNIITLSLKQYRIRFAYIANREAPFILHILHGPNEIKGLAKRGMKDRFRLRCTVDTQ